MNNILKPELRRVILGEKSTKFTAINPVLVSTW